MKYSYLVKVPPPKDAGGVKLTRRLPAALCVVLKFVTAYGAEAGVTVEAYVRGAELPAELFAFTAIVYAVPRVKPETVALSPVPDNTVCVNTVPPLVAVTVKLSIAAPFEAPGVNFTEAVPDVDPTSPPVDTELTKGAAGTSALIIRFCETGVATPYPLLPA
jgi:hypothetical protein